MINNLILTIIGAVLDSSVPVSDWSKMSVYRNIWVNVPVSKYNVPSDKISYVTRWFYSSFDFNLVRSLVVQKVRELRGGTNLQVDHITSEYEVVYHI